VNSCCCLPIPFQYRKKKKIKQKQLKTSRDSTQGEVTNHDSNSNSNSKRNSNLESPPQSPSPHDNNHDPGTNAPALPPMIESPTPSPDKPKLQNKAKPKENVERKRVTAKPAKTPSPIKKQKKRKTTKRKKKDPEEHDSEGSVGSLIDFVVDGNGNESDEDYDIRDDIALNHRNRNRTRNNRKRQQSVDSNGMLISDDEFDDDDEGLVDDFDSLMDIDWKGGGYDNHDSPTPKKKRKGVRTVCDMLPLCRYGKKCYQKNERHLREYGHPWKDKK